MSQPNTDKNKAIVLLKKAGMPMNVIIRTFGDNDRGSAKFNYYRVWRRDKDRYELLDFVKEYTNEIPSNILAFTKKHLQPIIKKYRKDGNNKPPTSSRTGTH